MPDMATVGEQLKAAREAQKLTVTEVAEMTKIRSDHIRAIDQGNYDVFSAPVYIRGFVRTYAVALKLDPAVIVAHLNQELAGAGEAVPVIVPHKASLLNSAMFHAATAGRRMVLPALAAVIVLGAVSTGVVLWNRHLASNPLSGLGSSFYQAPDEPGQTLLLPPPRR